MHHHSSEFSGSISDVCNPSLLNSVGHTGNRKRRAEDVPDTDAQTTLQRENDELKGSSFHGHLAIVLYADPMLDSKTPGSRGGSQPDQGGT